MAVPPVPPIEPVCSYDIDPNFPLVCDVDYTKAYCCNPAPTSGDKFVICKEEVGDCVVGIPGPGAQYMTFPIRNSDDQPMLKTALNGTTMSAWVKIAFQQYCGPIEYAPTTAQTIITMGNLSQPCNPEQCKAIIKAFQYGWGTVDQGNKVRVTIMDQKGSEFQQWVQRMGINPEGNSTPIQGKYRMKVQWGWYVTGGADEDICGQPPMPLGDPDCGNNTDLTPGGHLPIIPAAPGFNSAFIICSPVLYFLTDWINVHYENGKFIYEVEGTDTLQRGQENKIQQIFGRSGKHFYFTKAVELLGQVSFPQFRVEFKCLDSNGKETDIEFVKPNGDTTCREKKSEDTDCLGYGPYKIYRADTRGPLEIIREWLNQGVLARDKTGKVTSDKQRVGITLNYDPTYKFVPADDIKDKTTNDKCATCTSSQPQYGRLLVWANAIPYCQGNFTESQINTRLKAVYIVNGGNCSPVLAFAPTFRWHAMAAQRTAGNSTPVVGTNVDQRIGFRRVNCPIAAGSGPNKNAVPTGTQEVQITTTPSTQTQEAVFHHVMANLMIGAIEADLRVQGDPSKWLCSPIYGYGRCVGIVFVNPFFLVDDPNSAIKCPGWFATDPDSPNAAFKSSINELLTSKGWFIFGVDHQIKDGQYITTIKLKLIAPGAELNQAGSVVNLGAWDGTSIDEGTPMPFGGRFGCLDKFLVGNAGTAWGQSGDCPGHVTWIGGGTACSDNYVTDPNSPPD
jgi:hypothetical protein